MFLSAPHRLCPVNPGLGVRFCGQPVWMIGAGGRIRRIRRSAPIATRRKKYRRYRESKLRIVHGAPAHEGWAVQKCANSSHPWRLDMQPLRTTDDNRKSKASGLANHRVVNEARSAERDRVKIDAPYLEKSTATLQLSSRSRVFQTRRKKAARPKF